MVTLDTALIRIGRRPIGPMKTTAVAVQAVTRHTETIMTGWQTIRPNTMRVIGITTITMPVTMTTSGGQRMTTTMLMTGKPD